MQHHLRASSHRSERRFNGGQPHTLGICQLARRVGPDAGASCVSDTELDAIVDVVPEAADTLARAFGAGARWTRHWRTIIDAVIIASATLTHAELTEQAVQTGKAVFCEKPIDLDMSRVEACIRVMSTRAPSSSASTVASTQASLSSNHAWIPVMSVGWKSSDHQPDPGCRPRAILRPAADCSGT